ncbi:hypothetical protein HMPREF0262_00658 [Clostridium sp. ATCC 29733]|nr:hypothetical protein HMPREF0262_00658 [Clostridium sp. ATCC 29733]
MGNGGSHSRVLQPPKIPPQPIGALAGLSPACPAELLLPGRRPRWQGRWGLFDPPSTPSPGVIPSSSHIWQCRRAKEGRAEKGFPFLPYRWARSEKALSKLTLTSRPPLLSPFIAFGV